MSLYFPIKSLYYEKIRKDFGAKVLKIFYIQLGPWDAQHLQCELFLALFYFPNVGGQNTSCISSKWWLQYQDQKWNQVCASRFQPSGDLAVHVFSVPGLALPGRECNAYFTFPSRLVAILLSARSCSPVLRLGLGLYFTLRYCVFKYSLYLQAHPPLSGPYILKSGQQSET